MAKVLKTSSNKRVLIKENENVRILTAISKKIFDPEKQTRSSDQDNELIFKIKNNLLLEEETDTLMLDYIKEDLSEPVCEVFKERLNKDENLKKTLKCYETWLEKLKNQIDHLGERKTKQLIKNIITGNRSFSINGQS